MQKKSTSNYRNRFRVQVGTVGGLTNLHPLVKWSMQLLEENIPSRNHFDLYARYAKAYFETYNFDSITVAPYMGKDSVEPFLNFDEKYAIVLALTSNAGSSDFQTQEVGGQMLYEKVIQTSRDWKGSERLMYVVGATKASALNNIRALIPNSFLLIPGVGAQGGSLTEVAENGLSDDVGLLVNSSRGIIYASQGKDFDAAATAAAQDLQMQMQAILENKGFI